jgi:hypothetical protein
MLGVGFFLYEYRWAECRKHTEHAYVGGNLLYSNSQINGVIAHKNMPYDWGRILATSLPALLLALPSTISPKRHTVSLAAKLYSKITAIPTFNVRQQ